MTTGEVTTGFLDIAPHRLESRWIGPKPDAAPTLVLLHEGLGSVALWGDFPDKLAAASGYGVFLYSRIGYGQSSPAALPRPLDFMHTEAREVLPRVLDAVGFQRGLLVGHSDGGSVAAIHGASVEDHRVKGLVLIAPHFIVEPITSKAIAEMRQAYETTDLRSRLARFHKDVDATVIGWSDVWLKDEFWKWDLTGLLAYIRAPVLAIQGTDDQYGTMKQIELLTENCYCPVETLALSGVKHSPHREMPDVLIKAIGEFAKKLL